MHTRPCLRVGIFGVGRMGKVHLEHMVRRASRSEIELCAIGDRKQSTLESAAKCVLSWDRECRGGKVVVSPQHFTEPELMAAEVDLDAVVVASRTSDHVRDALAFTNQQVPVMVEKPVANSLSEVAGLSSALGDAADRLVFVAFQRHFDAAAELAKQWVDQGWIGSLQQSHHVIQDKNPTPVGYQSCGITADMAIHLVFESMSFHGFELPRYVQALRFNAPHYQDLANEGANIVHTFCSWNDGSLAHLWGSRLNATGYDNGFKLIGTGGRIDVGEFVGDFGEVTAKLWRGTGGGSIPRGTLAESHAFPMTTAAVEHPDFFPRYARAYDNELGAFLQHIRESTPFSIGLDIGWKTLLVANLAEASSRRGGTQFELVLRDGSSIGTAQQAAILAEEQGID